MRDHTPNGAPHFRKAVRKKIKPPRAIRGIMRTRKRDPERNAKFPKSDVIIAYLGIAQLVEHCAWDAGAGSPSLSTQIISELNSVG